LTLTPRLTHNPRADVQDAPLARRPHMTENARYVSYAPNVKTSDGVEGWMRLANLARN
jgi:hypothetical protein